MDWNRKLRIAARLNWIVLGAAIGSYWLGWHAASKVLFCVALVVLGTVTACFVGLALFLPLRAWFNPQEPGKGDRGGG